MSEDKSDDKEVDNGLKFVFNHIKDKVDERDRVYSTFLKAELMPKKLDLLAGQDPVYDQGTIGSCTGQATGSVISYIVRKLKSTTFLSIPSRLFIYTNGRRVGNLPINQDTGASIRDVIKGVALYYAADEKLWTYDIKNAFVQPPQQVYDSTKKHKVFQYLSVSQGLIPLKQCLVNGFPIIFGIQVYSSLMAPNTLKTGIIPMPNIKTEALQGGHCITIIGYDDTTQTFLIRNSWGSRVGLGGYFKIPYNYVLNPKLAYDFWTIRMFM